MKTITETIGGAQALLDIPFDLQECFEEKLNNEQKTFLHILRVVTGHLPDITRPYAGTGRIPYQYLPFVKSSPGETLFWDRQDKPAYRAFKSRSEFAVVMRFYQGSWQGKFFKKFEILV